MDLPPRYNTHKEQSREHFCPAASYITVLSIIPHQNATIRLSCDELSLIVKFCLLSGGTIDKTLIQKNKSEKHQAIWAVVVEPNKITAPSGGTVSAIRFRRSRGPVGRGPGIRVRRRRSLCVASGRWVIAESDLDCSNIALWEGLCRLCVEFNAKRTRYL